MRLPVTERKNCQNDCKINNSSQNLRFSFLIQITWFSFLYFLHFSSYSKFIFVLVFLITFAVYAYIPAISFALATFRSSAYAQEIHVAAVLFQDKSISLGFHKQRLPSRICSPSTPDEPLCLPSPLSVSSRYSAVSRKT